jgi:hypothetical protein
MALGLTAQASMGNLRDPGGPIGWEAALEEFHVLGLNRWSRKVLQA